MGFAANASAAEDETGTTLLLGNSFIAGIVAHTEPYSFTSRWLGGTNLRHHTGSDVSKALICAGFKFVVLQNSSIRAKDNDEFQKDIDAIVPLVTSCDATPVLLMTWESKRISFPPVELAYQQAAEKHRLQLVAVGRVWHDVKLANISMFESLLAEDGNHASYLGQRVIAAVMLRAFCEDCYRRFNWNGFTPSQRALLQSSIARHITTIEVPKQPSVFLPSILQLLL